MSFISNLFYRKSAKITDYPEFQFSFFKIQNQLRKSIMDFFVIKDLINLIKSRCQSCNEEQKRNVYEIIRKYIKYLFVDIIEKIKEKIKLETYYQLVTTINFFFVLLHNYQDKIFYETIFEKNCNLLQKIKKCFEFSLLYKEQFECSKILISFLSFDNIETFHSLGLRSLFMSLRDYFKDFHITVINFDKLKKFSHNEYKILMKHILVSEFDYNKIFETEGYCLPEDKYLCIFLI